jgi:hypothetical protein
MLLALDNPRSDSRVIGWCPACHLSWTSTTHAHCAACCRHFSSERAFDLHQRTAKDGRTVCRNPERLRGRNRLVLEDRTWALAAG